MKYSIANFYLMGHRGNCAVTVMLHRKIKFAIIFISPAITLKRNGITILYLFSFEDYDECADQNYHCPPYSHCVNVIGHYKCICNKGFDLDKITNYCTGT